MESKLLMLLFACTEAVKLKASHTILVLSSNGWLVLSASTFPKSFMLALYDLKIGWLHKNRNK